jgi:SulP family sulfate permease
VEIGVAAGVAVSLALVLHRTSRPHIAEVGRVPGGEHFRNVLRHEVETDPAVVTLRIDESLTFVNARLVEDRVYDRVVGDPAVRHVVLMCSAVNEVDLTALDALTEVGRRLGDMGILLHLSEVKGPVMDRLRRTRFLDGLTGRVFLSQNDAFEALARAGPAPASAKPPGPIHLGRGAARREPDAPQHGTPPAHSAPYARTSLREGPPRRR